jgi:hypothetical protein
MSNYKFVELPSNESVASVMTFLVSAWFVLAGAAMLAEPSVDQQVKALAAKTPVVTVRQLTAFAEPEARFTIEVVAKRDGARVS